MRTARPRLRYPLAAAGGFVLLLGVLAACGGDSTNAAGAGNGLEKAKVTVRYLPVADVAPLFIAQQRGYFAAEGLEVEPKSYPTAPPAVADMQAGRLDIAYANYVTFFSSQAKGIKFKVVADGYQAKAKVFLVMTAKDSPVKTVADLAGRTIGISTLKNVAELSTDSVLSANGVDPAMVKYKQVNNEDMALQVKVGQIDAGFFIEPFVSQAQQDGLVPLFDAAQGQTAGIAIGGYAATEQWAAKNPKTLAAFNRAMAKAQAAAADRQALEQVLPTYTKIDAKTASVITFGGFPSTVDKTRLQRVVDLMKQFGLLTGEQAGKVNVDEMLT
jgi:NitT/TauT family transport system substrate-binding protein